MKQTASEKRLFTKLDELAGKVDHYGTVVDELTDRVGFLFEATRKINSDIRTAVKAGNGTIDRVAAIEQRQVLASPVKPQDYVLTDADWQRVITEGWLCEFWDIFDRHIAPLSVVTSASADRRFAFNALTEDARKRFYPNCRPLNKPGVMQPYFGQGMPCKGDVRVVVKLKSGQVNVGRALQYEWSNDGGAGDITAWMQVP